MCGTFILINYILFNHCSHTIWTMSSNLDLCVGALHFIILLSPCFSSNLHLVLSIMFLLIIIWVNKWCAVAELVRALVSKSRCPEFESHRRRFESWASSFTPRCLIVQQISDKIWLNCAFNDTSMTFGTLLENTFLVIFGYRAIADLTCDKIGSHFPIWPPSSLGKRGFVWENCGT